LIGLPSLNSQPPFMAVGCGLFHVDTDSIDPPRVLFSDHD